MGALRRTADALGRTGIALLLLAPVLAGVVVFALAPTILSAKFAASARLDLYPVVGTHASYEVASSISDFGTEYMARNAEAARASGQEVSDVASLLTATRTEDSALAQIGFQAPTADGAEKGLRAAAEAALTTVAQGNLTRADITVRAAQTQLDSALRSDTSLRGIREDLRNQVRQRRLESATMAGTPVTVDQISTTSEAVRLALAAAVTALLLAAAGVVLMRRGRILNAFRSRPDLEPGPCSRATI